MRSSSLPWKRSKNRLAKMCSERTGISSNLKYRCARCTSLPICSLSASTEGNLISFLQWRRAEIKFPSVEALKEQNCKDVQRAHRYFKLLEKTGIPLNARDT